MKPIDEFSYIKQNKVSIDSSGLIQLYFPIIGNDAVAVYDYLINFFDEGNSISFGISALYII